MITPHRTRRASHTWAGSRAKVMPTKKAAEMRKGRGSYPSTLRHAVR